MAITNLGGSNLAQFAYNPINYRFDSTNKNQSGMRYVIEIFDAGTSNLYIKQLVAPDPLNNKECRIDLSRILQNRVDRTTQPINQSPVNSFYRYDIKVGESYTINWNFIEYLEGSNDSVILNSPLNHNYVQNDQINVQLTTVHNDNRDLMNGIWTVTEVISATSIRISMKYSTIGFTTAGTTGTTTSATNNKFVALNLFSLADRRVWNGSLSPLVYPATNGGLGMFYTSGFNFSRFLTNQPQDWRVISQSKSIIRLNMYTPNNNVLSIRYRDITNNQEFYLDTDPTIKFLTINAGLANIPADLTPIGAATLPFIKPTTKQYEVYLMTTQSGGTTQVSERRRFIIDERCIINDYSINFLDRLGSESSFNFTLREIRNISTNKETYNKQSNYYTTGGNNTVYYSEYQETLILNTNWLTSEENLYFEELLTSPYTVLTKGGSIFNVKVQDGDSETTLQKNKRLHRRTINVEMNMVTNINI